MDVDQLQQSYEDVPYPDLCYTQTHPDRLATLATFLGMRPAAIGTCRVLELGCASGGNLIPMAYGLPGSQFLGIDFSAAQISAGKKNIEALGLGNIELRQADILSLPAELGEFDYIIAHGVYSWVPPAVRDQLLAICRESLSADGVAYISYNTLPGWHMLGALRNMMLFHSRKTTDPQERVAQSRELLDFLTEAVPTGDDPYGTFLQAYGNMIHAYSSFVTQEREHEHSGHELLLHDELEAVNDPVYFHQFASHATEHGLQYLVEADFARVVPTNFPPPVAKRLMKMSSDIIEVEQYMDFLRNRTLRQTLLCHQDVNIQRALRPDPDKLAPFFIATYAQPTAAGFDLYDSSVVKFQGPDGSVLAVDHPVSKVAMMYLAQVSPQAVPFMDLFQFACGQVYPSEPPAESLTRDAIALSANIMRAYSYSTRLVELHLHAPQFALEGGQHPIASRLARQQAAAGATKVANLRHERVKLDPVSQHLLPHLDGKHSREQLLGILTGLVNDGDIKLSEMEKTGGDPADTAQLLAKELSLNLGWLGRAALLEA